MKVSIVLAAYNIEKYLQECLDSIYESISESDEIIIVDDGSTDSTAQIVRNAADKHSQVIVHRKSNGGISSARNDGLALASGDYIIFADGDDVFIPETYKFARKHLEQSGADILVTDHLNWLNDGKGPCIAAQPRSHQPFVNCTNRTENVVATLSDCMPCTWTRFIKRDLLRRLPPRPFSENLMYDDLPLIPHITAEACSLYYVPLPLIKYRSRPNSVTKSRSYRSCTDMVAAAAQASKAIHLLPLDASVTLCADLMLARKTLEAIRQSREVRNPSYRLYDEIIATSLAAFKSSPLDIYTALCLSPSKHDRRIAKHIIFISFTKTAYIAIQILLTRIKQLKRKK